jgi:hypothetical protein
MALAKTVLAIASAAIAPVALGPVLLPVLFISIILTPGSSAGLLRGWSVLVAPPNARGCAWSMVLWARKVQISLMPMQKGRSQASLHGLRGGIGHRHAPRQGGVYHS